MTYCSLNAAIGDRLRSDQASFSCHLNTVEHTLLISVSSKLLEEFRLNLAFRIKDRLRFLRQIAARIAFKIDSFANYGVFMRSH